MLVVVCWVFATAVGARGDEPNDTLATATTTELVGVGTVTLANMTLGDGDQGVRDVDVYAFAVDEATSLPVSLTVSVDSDGHSWDAFLRIFDATGAELANNDDRAFDDSDPRIRTLLVGHGRYFVGVSAVTNPHYVAAEPDEPPCDKPHCEPAGTVVGGAGVGGTYDVTITILPASAPVDEAEPNDSIGNATVVGAESVSLSGRFIGDGPYGRRDVDIYELRLHGAARIEATVRAGSIDSTLEPVLRIRNCLDDVVNFTDVDPCLMGTSDAALEGKADASLVVGALQRQSVYLMVSGAGNRRYDPAVAGSGEMGSVGFYELDVRVEYYDPLGEFEPNDSIRQATRLNVFTDGRPTTHVAEAAIGDGRYAPFSGDRDFYEVVVPDETKFLTVTVSGTAVGSELDPVVTVYGPPRARVPLGESIAHNDNWGGGTDASVVVPIPCGSAFEGQVSAFVEVFGARRRPATDPTIPFSEDEIEIPDLAKVESYSIEEATGSTGAYRLTLQVDPVAHDCGTEPNDTLEFATDTGLTDEGVFVCTGGFFGDSECFWPGIEVDMYRVQVTRTPIFLEASVIRCGDGFSPSYAFVVVDAAGDLVGYRPFDYNAQMLPPVHVRLDQPGAYYVLLVSEPAVEPQKGLLRFDPNVACTAPDSYLTSDYDLIIRMAPRPQNYVSDADGLVGAAASGDELLYATRLDDVADRIDVLDADSGAAVDSFPAPEPRFGGGEGLAFDGRNLFYVGVGHYPQLYRLDPTTGRVLDEYALWFGSGYISDAVAMAGELFLLDYRHRSVHVMDPASRRYLRTLNVGFEHGVTLAGGLAALPGPERLYAADALNTRDIYEIHPLTGEVTGTLVRGEPRPTALAATGDGLLYVGNWRSESLKVLERDGSDVATVQVDSPVGSMAAYVRHDPFGDFDRDGDVDLRDHAAFGRCFTGGSATLGLHCARADGNGDGVADLADLGALLTRTGGPSVP